ncbi:hypothetical protein SmJEL517_g03813 [Synchytrium microbalum]|uniref:Bystin n=1 Tax=Synchytrium microbalum TaxID=1806994 RepID=A0A507C6K0_9FUNG|nr:uncharacterized protein SmJEL517_g03813 [Synchytrium microbalum]TPX33173.1 hypothetical protein SmJEL517_g03813 [Synchytrium microbalum]
MVQIKSKKKSLPSRHNPTKPKTAPEREAFGQEFNLETWHDSRTKQSKQRQRDAADIEDADESTVIDTKTSQKILSLAREQQDELNPHAISSTSSKHSKKQVKKQQPVVEDSSDEEEYLEDDGGLPLSYDDAEAELGIDASDQAILEKFMSSQQPRRQLALADAVMDKISAEKQVVAALAAASTDMVEEGDGEEEGMGQLNPKVVEVYTKVGMILSRYRSGKLPKTFKIIPTLSNWEDILLLTNPETWTPHATYQATRIFSSNLKANMAQRFYSVFLLDRIRAEISETKKLNVHLYNALKKALYKPAAFFKGFLLPLCESGTCTLREAAIIGSVLTKISIPALHSAACLLKLAELEYTGANSLFIRVLLDKKYALPFKVLDALVFHFLRFKKDERDMPVLWHQSLLVFCQRYKADLTDDQKEALLELIKHKIHYAISPEVRRELSHSVGGAAGELVAEEDLEDSDVDML